MIFKAGDSNGAKQYGIVPIIDDEIVEAPESFVIKLTSIDSGLTPTTFSSATINIIDNDSKCFRISIYCNMILCNALLLSSYNKCFIKRENRSRHFSASQTIHVKSRCCAVACLLGFVPSL